MVGRWATLTIALLAGGPGCQCADSEPSWLATAKATVVRRPLRGWTLSQGDGTPLSERWFVGHVSLVLVGYARCPDVCPNTLTLLADAKAQRPDLQVLFLSVDPDHDQDDLSTYITFFDPALTAATGPRNAIDHAVAQLGAAYTFVDGGVDHSTSLFVVDENANVAGVLLRPTQGSAVLRDLDTLLRERPGQVQAMLNVPMRPPHAPGIAYGTLETTAPLRLTHITSPDVERIELHRTVVTPTTAHMQPVPTLDLSPATPTRLEPGGLHLMLLGERRSDAPLLELHFAHATSALVATHAAPR
ncbi:MAG: SCO family protein [Myxococcota bacterium]